MADLPALDGLPPEESGAMLNDLFSTSWRHEILPSHF
jgi:hypothetical protein